MPAPSFWMVRTAFVYLALGFTIGAVLLVQKGVEPGGMLFALRQAHVECLLVGWMLQLAFGVAAWILPRTPLRTSQRPVWLVFGLLNGGVVLAAAGSVAAAAAPLVAAPVVVAGRVLEVAAAGTFGHYIWPRVRSFRSHA